MRRKARDRGHPVVVALRQPQLLWVDTHVPYDVPMADREIDRARWAHLVAELLDAETNGNKTRFAKLVGVEYKTINRWLNKIGDVSEESVRKVAAGLGRNPMEMLVQIGYYHSSEVDPPQAAPDDNDAAIAMVRDDPDLPPHRKARIIERLVQMGRDDETRRLAIATALVEQAKSA